MDPGPDQVSRSINNLQEIQRIQKYASGVSTIGSMENTMKQRLVSSKNKLRETESDRERRKMGRWRDKLQVRSD